MHAVVYPVGFLARGDNAFVAQDGEMLRNVALCGAHSIHNVLHADFAFAKNTKNFQAQRVGHGFERVGRAVDVFSAGR